MKRFYVSFFVSIFFLSFFTNQTTVCAENHYRGIKAAVGVAGIAGSLVLWRHFGKKIERVEKLQKIFEKVRGVNHGYAERIKKLLLYKHLCLFGALLSFGYTVKQVAGILKEVAEARAEKEEEKDDEDESDDTSRWPTYSGWSEFTCNDGNLVVVCWQRVDKMFLFGVDRFPEPKNKEKFSQICDSSFSRYDFFSIPLEDYKQAQQMGDVVGGVDDLARIGNSMRVSEVLRNFKTYFETGFKQRLKESASVGSS